RALGGGPGFARGPGFDSGPGPDSAPGADSSSGSPDNGACHYGAAFNGNGSFTWYYFGQGTGQEGGYHVTACGYRGTEAGSGQGAADTGMNIADSGRAKNTYFAAIPSVSPGNFDTVGDCGACVEITNGAAKIIATIIDACPKDGNPPCQSAGHLDLSTQAFDALGYSVGDPSGTTWQFVAC